jgi:hypothetical protein
MSITKNPAIASLAPGSLCHSLYSALYSQFFNAQDRKDAEHPYGVEEGDGVSIRLHNAAYGFAYAIAGAVDGGGSGEGGILLDYLRKDGSDMTGLLRANHGFEAGQENKVLLQTYSAGIRFNEHIDIFGDIFMAGNRVIGYAPDLGVLEISANTIDFGDSVLKSGGSIQVGDVLISRSGVKIDGHNVWHEGNANLSTVDWAMKNATVAGSLNVAGSVELSGYLRAVHGVSLGVEGREMMVFYPDGAAMYGDLSFGEGYGIRIGGITVLGRTGVSDITIGGAGGNLLLGSENTNKIKLLSGIMDADGDYQLLSPYGAAHFPDSLTVRHNYGDELLSTYRVDSTDEGIVIHKRLRFGTQRGSYLYAKQNGIALNSFFEYTENNTLHKVEQSTTLRYGVSTSLFAPMDRLVGSLIVETDADSVLFTKPVEANNRIGIAGTLTRLTSGALFFTDDIRMVASASGVKHHGNAWFLGDVGSELFSSGFAGSGWAIQKNQITGNTVATVDELTVRKRMRIYELQVQKTSVTNGSLWISHSCSGDRVERIN